MESKKVNDEDTDISKDIDQLTDNHRKEILNGGNVRLLTEFSNKDGSHLSTDFDLEKRDETVLVENNADHAVRENEGATVGEEGGVVVECVVEIENKKPSALDGGWGWFIVAGTFLVHVILGGFHRSNGVLYLQLRERYHMSATTTSWVLALFSTMTLSMGPVASALCNRFSVRFVVNLGSVLCLIGTLVSAFSPNLWFLYFSYSLVAGFGRALVYCPSLLIVSYYFNKRRGIAVGLATSGGGVGSFFFPPLFEGLFDQYGFKGTFIILSAITFNSLISGCLFRPLELQQRIIEQQSNGKSQERRKKSDILGKDYVRDVEVEELHLLEINHVTNRTNHVTNSNEHVAKKAREDSARRRPSLIKRKLSEMKMAIKGLEAKKTENKPFLELSLFRNYAFTSLCILMLMFNISFSVTFIFLPALVQTKGLTKLQGAYLLSIIGISDAVGRIVVSFLLDLKRIKKFRLIIYNVLVVMIGVVSDLIPLMHTFAQFAVLCVMYGVLTGTYVSQKSVVLVDIVGVENMSSAFGMMLLAQGIGSLIGPTIGGLFKDFIGSYDMSFFCGSAGIYLGAIALATGNIWLHKRRKKTLVENTNGAI